MLTSACSTAQAPAPPAVAKNVLLITIDTLRADRIGVYGAKDVETPNIDRLAREGAWSRHSTVHVPLTRPSHVSIFTGLYPAEHGIRDNVSPALRPDIPLLAERFQSRGRATAAFVSSVVLSRQAGLARGFDHYSDRFEIGEDDARFLNTIQKRGDEVTAEAIEWIRQHAGGFFAWVHLYDPHDPYEPPGRYAIQYANRPYDGEVAWSDELVGRLLSVLQDTRVADDTLVIVTSDHGEGLGEHGEDVHGYFIYETTLRVPLVVRGPGVKPGTRIDAVTRSVDLFPTILAMSGLRDELPSSGRSLRMALGGGRLEEEPTFAESLVPLVHFGWSDLRAVRDGRWKFILAPRPELYDLESDPRELQNMADAEPARARAMRAGLEQRLRQEQTTARSDASAAAVPPDLLEKLGALGYVSPGGPSDAKAAGADPKDKLQEYKTLNTLMRQGMLALRAGRPAESVEHFRGLARRGVDSFERHYYMGRAYTALRRWREAAAEYEQAVNKLPAYGAAWRALGESRVALRDVRGAAAAFEKLASLSPRDALVRVQLGEAYRDMGRTEDAARVMREAVAIDPAPASYWNSLGMVLGGSGRMAEAEQAFAEAVSRDTRNAQYVYNRGLVLQRLGRRDDALIQFRRAAELGFPPARARLAELGDEVR